jgi:integral membrane protein
VSGALKRYRVMAYVVGVMLLVLVFVAIPIRYLGDNPRVSEIVSPIHGFLYIVYVVVAFDLGSRMRWPFRKTIWLCLAGTIPFVSFVMEPKVTREVKAHLAATT